MGNHSHISYRTGNMKVAILTIISLICVTMISTAPAPAPLTTNLLVGKALLATGFVLGKKIGRVGQSQTQYQSSYNRPRPYRQPRPRPHYHSYNGYHGCRTGSQKVPVELLTSKY